MRNKKVEFIIGMICILMGIGIIVLGIFLYNSTEEFKKVAVETTAKVEKVSEYKDSEDEINYRVYITYEVDGKEYKNTYSTSFYIEEGSTRTIYYDKNDPSFMQTSIVHFTDFLVMGIGAILIIVGLIVSVPIIVKKIEKTRLLKNGEEIIAEFKEITINHADSVRNNHPYNIICTAKDFATGKERFFKSEDIWYNPKYIIEENCITTFPVYIDKKNRNKYYVSLKEIERLD